MSDPGKAVFLSYASQDAAAAKRICDALRAAGVEVWFDQNELVGGDAWDHKIRGQIASCALFVPVISANTQARREGYFRIEWKLAAQRTYAMSDDTPFLLPLVIDDTRDADARVPAEFKAVQWTRLRGGEATPMFVARVQKLLNGGPARQSASRPPIPTIEAESPRPAARSRWPWIAGAIAALVIGYIVVTSLNSPWSDPATALKAMAEQKAAAAPVSAARELVAKVWEQLNKPDLARAQLETADEFGRQATEFGPNDADAWAAWSQVDSWAVYHHFDASAARREAARTKAARAMQLAPDSYEARLAQACYFVRGQAGGDATLSIYAGEAEKLLRALLKEKPDEPRVLLTLGILLRNTGAFPEARELFRRLADNLAFAAMAWNELGWAEYMAGDYTAAGVAIDRSIALQAYWGNLTLKQVLAQWWLGDLDRAKAAQDQMPVAARQEDIGVYLAVGLAHWRREPQIMLQILRGVSRDWLQSNAFVGPTAWYAALAHQMAGQEAAAQMQWRAALAVVEGRLATQPDSGFLIHWKGTLLAALGNRTEAGPLLKLAHEIGSSRSDSVDDATALLWMNQPDAAIAVLDRMATLEKKSVTAAAFRLNPVLDPLRAHPRFQALLTRLEADPRFSPKATRKVKSPTLSLSLSLPPDAKSVAVLAFANLSDDKANEYFSDGISEELMTVLQKIPGLHVAARSSAFSFKGTQATAQEIGAKLGVAHLVEGSVQKSAGRVKITARLSRVANGEELWSKSFPAQELKDVFAAQEEIARAIVGELRERLTGALDEKARGEIAAQVRAAERGGTQDPEAQELFLQGRFAERQNSVEGHARAENFYRRATERDPRFARAWAGLGRTIFWQAGNLLGTRTLDQAAEEARRAIQNALALEPELDEGLLGLAYIQSLYDLDAQASLATVHRALAVAPTAPVLAAAAGLESAQGHQEPALALARRAVALDPLDESARASLRAVLFNLGRFDELQAEWRRALAASPEMAFLHGELAGWAILEGRWDEAERAVALEKVEYARDYLRILLLWRQGRKAESEAQLRKFEQNNASGAAFQIAMVHADRGDREQAFAWLERAYRQHDGGIMGLRVNPYFRPLHGDPRWQPLLRKLGLADEQVK